jgi:hypothetical protein
MPRLKITIKENENGNNFAVPKMQFVCQFEN